MSASERAHEGLQYTELTNFMGAEIHGIDLNVPLSEGAFADLRRLLADHILQHIGSERSDPIREMHFLMFFCFFAFSNLRRVRGFQNIFRHQPSPAEARQAGSSQAGPSRAAPTGRPYTP